MTCTEYVSVQLVCAQVANETAPLRANDGCKTRFKYDFAVPANSIGAAPATRMRVTVSTKLD